MYSNLYTDISTCETIWKSLWKQLMTCPKKLFSVLFHKLSTKAQGVKVTLSKHRELLRKKGLASADKKAAGASTEGRMILTTTEGRIGSMNSYLLLSY